MKEVQIKIFRKRIVEIYIMGENGCSHGPQVWPWWKLFWISPVMLRYYPDLPPHGVRF